MGTNYYFYTNICKYCGRRDETKHIGKSSAGWVFTLHVIPDEGINDLDDWKKLFSQSESVIKNEYGDIVSVDHLMKIITDREWGDRIIGEKWYRENQAEPGPFGLARHVIDVHHCIKHGSGTWDCIIGEFS